MDRESYDKPQEGTNESKNNKNIRSSKLKCKKDQPTHHQEMELLIGVPALRANPGQYAQEDGKVSSGVRRRSW